MKIKLKNTATPYKANAREINNIPKNNPIVAVFDTLDGYFHCMTLYAAQRSMKKTVVSATILKVSTGEVITLYKKDQIERFMDLWRDNYFNENFKLKEVTNEEE